jgi:osmotically-inducible protein OsmY
MRRILAIPLMAALSAGVSYFFHPQNGKRRRTMLAGRIAAFFRQSGRKAERAGQGAAAQAHRLKEKAMHLREEEKPQPDDVTLARKVETEIFRDPDVPKGRINVNAEDGVVYLRGEVPSAELVDDLGKAAHKVQGVRAVENLLHVPGTPAPQKAD